MIWPSWAGIQAIITFTRRGVCTTKTPSQGVLPNDMMRHILGEALNVGSVLTWGPCYYYQKQFFEAKDHQLSTADNLMRYDVEVSGFPSSHSGHLVLLRLKEQDYPGSQKSSKTGPRGTCRFSKWAKAQGAVVGFAHSGWGLEVKTDKLPTLRSCRSSTASARTNTSWT